MLVQPAPTDSTAAWPGGAPAAPTTSTFTDKPMAGVFDPTSLDGANIEKADATDPDWNAIARCEEELGKFTGDPEVDRCSALAWSTRVMRYRRGPLKHLDELLFAGVIRKAQGEEVQRALEGLEMDSPGALLLWLCEESPQGAYQRALHKRLETGAAFVGCTRDNVCARAIAFLGELEGYTAGVPDQQPQLWQHGLHGVA